MLSEESNLSAAQEADETPLVGDEVETLNQPEAVSFSYEELKDDFISNQTWEKGNAFFEALLNGFQSLREASDANKVPLGSTSKGDASASHDEGGRSQHKAPTMHITVNVIDPTTKPSLSTPKVDNLLARSRLAPPSASAPVENVYEKLSSIFEKDYGSTLRAVQCKNIRSGSSDVISSIPVHMVLTRTGTASGSGEANVAWGGLAGSAATISADPAEWHTMPFCHVYVAACENVDHYRTKVRPSIQAFVSQLEASVGTPGSKSTSAIGTSVGNSLTQGGSAFFLIVFVPMGGDSHEKNTSSRGPGEDGTIHANAGPVRRVLATQFAKARERIANYQQDLDNNSTHSADSQGSTDRNLNDEESDMPSVSIQRLTTNDKMLYKKMIKDFPHGKVCVLSKSSLERFPDDRGKGALTADDETGTVIRLQEWNAFNRMLGSVIVNGFVDRCRRYNDELRRLDSQRAMAAQALKNITVDTMPRANSNGGFFGGNPNTAKGTTPLSEFNLGYFFLVKESLAFTYEQMQLPAEALLQYDEFRAFLPDLTDKEYKKAIKARRKSKALQEAGPALVSLADAAEFVGFRKRLRTEFDLTPLLEIVRRYLFAREIRLLFKMEEPVEVISRCEVFCRYMYSVMMRGITTCTEEERQRRMVEAAKWVVQFAWDVKTACEKFLSSIGSDGLTIFERLSQESMEAIRFNDSGNFAQSEQHVASRLGEFLEMARLMYKQLGDVELSSENSLRRYEHSFPRDMLQTWESWACPEVHQGDAQPVGPGLTKNSEGGGRVFILENAFASNEGYEDAYLEIISAIVVLGRFGHRRRQALRLQAELAEHLIRKGDLRTAASILKAAVKLYRWDQWDRCHFWRLFRLSYCQRSTAYPTDYLKTLAACFTPRTLAVAPKKALEALQDDLELVVDHPSIGESKYGTIAFIETSIEVMETAADTSRMGSGIDSKELVKRFCSVGETVHIAVTLISSLSREIMLDSLKLLIVDFATFLKVVESRESVEEEDAFKTLTLDGGIKVKPGANKFQLEWSPATSGQFILSTIEIVWKQGYFYYDSMELPARLLGIDVLPSEPTHSLSIEPRYLVPGHDQQIQITFDAGSDLVTAGLVQLTCSQGLLIIGPGEDPANGQWKTECEVRLGSFKPGGKTVITAHIRCALIETFSHDSIMQTPSLDHLHGLKARTFTKYLHSVAQASDLSSTPEMKNVSETVVPILEKTALSVERVDTIWLTQGERVLISIDLMANTPDHFSILEWKLLVQSPLKLAEAVDHNDDLRNRSVSDGDQLFLAFECDVSKVVESADQGDVTLRAKLCDDNQKMFTLDLGLDLSGFYHSLLSATALKTLASAAATLKLPVDEGRVGEPIKLSYNVETAAEGTIVYTIDPAGSDWLLSGKVSGSMQRSGFMSLGFMGTCDVMGIPTVPGILTSFPKIQLGIVSLQGGYTPLLMQSRSPARFRSLAKTSTIAVAFPTNKIAV